MLKLILLDKSKWVVYFPGENSYTITDYRGAIKVLRFMDIDKKEIILAVSQMEATNNNCADFGVFGKFTYTSDFEFDVRLAA